MVASGRGRADHRSVGSSEGAEITWHGIARACAASIRCCCGRKCIGEPLEQNTAVEQMEAESSRVSAGRARVDRPLNGAIQWATSYIDSAAALPAGVFVHRRDACKWSR